MYLSACELGSVLLGSAVTTKADERAVGAVSELESLLSVQAAPIVTKFSDFLSVSHPSELKESIFFRLYFSRRLRNRVPDICANTLTSDVGQLVTA
ncbi:hypothetical protein L6164_021218 [Bauhinia variegata]|uniref:Uncharacterized protein n=1 Tax=Bauhinia variegata TaxID=167791 RepID=A0ACB9MXM7_BAUVA|nr:hypothetical protein L6164_021218 [Bauhinia variegata]